MSKSTLRLGVCQIQCSENKSRNFQILKQLIQQSGDDCDVVVFPENSTYIRVSSNEKYFGSVEIGDPIFYELSELASSKGVTVILGGVPLKEGELLVNATICIRPNSEPQIVYRKIHMFDVDVGDVSIRESDTFTAGENASIIEVEGWRLGLTICYDLRFSNLFELYYREKVDLILIPAAFLVETGKAHWETLVRSRAIEGQCFVVAPAQVGMHLSEDGERKRYSYGHSLVISPWGEVMADLKEEVNVVKVMELSKDSIKKVQNSIPVCDHRKVKIPLKDFS
ncbi:MAG: hypothetical protein CL677_09160 [Bdellovibrionaceae bacterium]|nr:hypothetical protein [Pseudobdellovibrionaceae bacterium]|tara:strand:+ start:36220 stop:37065 length:846 start_codon:yes stop_codon:yes gene_type:complete